LLVHFAQPDMQHLCCEEAPHEYAHLRERLGILLAYVQVADSLQTLEGFLGHRLEFQDQRLHFPLGEAWVLVASIPTLAPPHPITLLLESVLERTRTGRR